jgi:hypothetical protein
LFGSSWISVVNSDKKSKYLDQTGRERMQRFLLIAFAFSILLLTHVNNSYSMAQISMQNNTSLWLNLYIDGNFGCGPVMPEGFCTSSVNAVVQ